MTENGKRQRPCGDTERQKVKRASAAHLRDLRRAHGRAPADVELPSVAVPRRWVAEPVASYCTSPAELCAELVR